MRIQKLTTGKVADYTIDDLVITFGEISIDCESLQSDQSIVVDIFKGAEGAPALSGSFRIATVKIPPKNYHNEIQEIDGEETTVRIADALDAKKVLIQLLEL